MHDELFKPTLTGRALRIGLARPWRLTSQFYVAFFGGVLAVTAIAIANARRLGMSVAEQAAIGAAGTAGFLCVVAAAAASDPGSGLRLGVKLIAVLAWGAMYVVQRVPDRVHSYHSADDEPYESLWKTGMGLIVPFGLAQAALVVALSGGVA